MFVNDKVKNGGKGEKGDGVIVRGVYFISFVLYVGLPYRPKKKPG